MEENKDPVTNALANWLSSSEILIRPAASAPAPPAIPTTVNAAQAKPYQVVDKESLANFLAPSSKPEEIKKEKKSDFRVMHIIQLNQINHEYSDYSNWGHFPASTALQVISEVPYSERAFKEKSVSVPELMKAMATMGPHGRTALVNYVKMQSEKQGKKLGIGALHFKFEDNVKRSYNTTILESIYVVLVEEGE